MTHRQIKILEILSQKQRMEVTMLSEMLDVSQVTIRKDLDFLEDRGFITREHGVASLDGLNDFGRRMANHYDIKKRLAKAAAATVKDGETVIIESGSCCALLAEELAISRKDVTIITNSLFITNFIRHLPSVKIILLGGCYQPDSQVLVGHLVKKCAEVFFSNKFFIGADGYSSKYGFTGNDYMRVQTIQEMSEYVRGISVITESEKFNQQGVLGLVRAENIQELFTDDGIPVDAEAVFLKNNVLIHKVPQHV